MMMNIVLSKGRFAQIDDGDFEWLSQQNWHAHATKPDVFYARGSNRLFMHRVIMNAQRGQIVDHIDLNTLNNCRSNLRLATMSQNGANRIASKGRKFKGVFAASGGGYSAHIVINRKRHYLGFSMSEEDAARLYDDAAIKFFGEFARLNLPSINP